MKNESYELTPNGLLDSKFGDTRAQQILDALYMYTLKIGKNAIIFKDGTADFVKIEFKKDGKKK